MGMEGRFNTIQRKREEEKGIMVFAKEQEEELRGCLQLPPK